MKFVQSLPIWLRKWKRWIPRIISILKRNHIETIHCHEANEALEYLRNNLDSSGNIEIDVMITDLMLSSSMSGFEMIQAIRNDLKLDYLELPILLMTIEPGDDEKTDFTGIFGAGTNDFITKPVNEADLISRLQTLVNIKRQNEALNQ